MMENKDSAKAGPDIFGNPQEMSKFLVKVFDKIDSNPASVVSQLDNLGAVHGLVTLFDSKDSMCGQWIKYRNNPSDIGKDLRGTLNCTDDQECVRVLRDKCPKEFVNAIFPIVTVNLAKKFVGALDHNLADLVHGFTRRDVLISQIKVGVWSLYNMFLFDNSSKRSALSVALNTPAGMAFFAYIGRLMIERRVDGSGDPELVQPDGIDYGQEILYSTVAKQISEKLRVKRGLSAQQSSAVFAFVKNYMALFTHLKFGARWRHKNVDLNTQDSDMLRTASQYMLNFLIDYGIDYATHNLIQ